MSFTVYIYFQRATFKGRILFMNSSFFTLRWKIRYHLKITFSPANGLVASKILGFYRPFDRVCCIFRRFREHLIFANRVKIHTWDVKNLDFGMEHLTPIHESSAFQSFIFHIYILSFSFFVIIPNSNSH